MSKIDWPMAFEQAPAGRFVATGIEWVRRLGIDEVEVRVVGGP